MDEPLFSKNLDDLLPLASAPEARKSPTQPQSTSPNSRPQHTAWNVSPEAVLNPQEYANYLEVRRLGGAFIVLGLILILVGVILAVAAEGQGERKRDPAEGVVAALVGLLGVAGGIAVLVGNRRWSPLMKAMAWVYVWGFPIGTILSFNLFDGLAKYLKSVARIRRARSGEPDGDAAKPEHTAPGARKDSWECPRCGSPRVLPRPPSQISPRPGYQCENCGLLMRDRGMFLVYLIVLAIGCLFAGSFLYLLTIGPVGPREFIRPLIGAVCAVYSIRELIRPVPKRSTGSDGVEK